MRNHTTAYEETIKTFGRQQAIRITFGNVVLTGDDINSCTPSFKASLLKSCMKEVRIDSNTEIPVGTEIHLEHGILVGNSYEYLDYGYYTVYQVEKKEDTSSFDILCYDKMILAMVDYIDLEIDFPITIRNYIAEICNHLEIDFGSNQDQFVNYDKEIQSELYLDENGDSLNYTFRDVLDEIAQATASVICIDNENKLVVKYPERQGEFETLEGTSLYIENADDTKIDLELQGNTTQNGTPTPTSPVPINNVTGKQVVTICGKNLFNKSNITNGRLDTNGNVAIIDEYFTSSFIKVEPNTQYAKNSPTADAYHRVCFYSSNNISDFISRSESNTFTTPNNCQYIRFCGLDTELDTTQLEKGTSTTYEKYQGKDYEINLGGDNLIDFANPTTLTQGTTSSFNDNTIIVTNNSGTYKRAEWNILSLLKANPNRILKFSYKTISSNAHKSVQIRIKDNGTNLYYSLLSSNYTIPSDTTNITEAVFQIYSNNSNTSLEETTTIEEPMLQFGVNNIGYVPYTENPIELNKIGTYQDFIRKGNGYQLFDKTTENILNAKYSNGIVTADNNERMCYIPCKPNTTYTLYHIVTSPMRNSIGTTTTIPEIGTTIDDGVYSNTSPKTITTNANAKYLVWQFYAMNDTTHTLQQVLDSMIIIEGSYSTSTLPLYEPYGYKDKWYIGKYVGKVILNGTETWTWWSSQSFTNTMLLGTNILDNISKVANTGICNRFVNSATSLWAEDTEGMQINNTGGNQLRYRVSKSIATNDTTFKTWLGSNNIITYYVLATPTYTLIENEELLNQLEAVQLQVGLNNVLVSGNLPSTIKVSYVEEFKSIDEEQLKDINVNFGEKFGPINSVVIARAADSDFIYKEDEQSVEENGLCEIRISDNQILNGDNRVEFLNGIYYQLRGTEYYLNDFSSTGITYLDLLDYYKVNVFNNSYKCLMLNDDIKITQGIEEQVHTEMPETTETEYKALSKQDKDIRKIGIIVNKVDGEITAEIIARQNTDENVSRLQQSIGEISSIVSTTTEQVTDIETIINEQSTTISQTAEGLSVAVANITSVQDGLETLETNTQDIVNQLVFGADGLTISNKGSSSADMKLNLTNEAIRFLYQNNAVLTINGSVIEFSNASFRKLDLGNYVWQAEDDDSLSLIYES